MKRKCGILLLVLSMLTGLSYAQMTDDGSLGRVLYVDDDAPGDPGPNDPEISDPREDGSKEHPFDGIQKAIDAAYEGLYRTSDGYSGGDTIIVAPGSYLSADPWAYDEINFKGKPIRLINSAPTDFSVIEKTVLCGVVIFQGDEGSQCLLQGFKIHNYDCGGILGNGTAATISHCIISGNGPCGATVIKDCQGPIKNCLIVDNTTFYRCGVSPVISGCIQLINCTIANNISGVLISGPAAATGRTDYARSVIHNCIIHGNTGQQIMIASGHTRPSYVTIDHCLIQSWDELDVGAETVRRIIDGDPCFVRPSHPSATEPVIAQAEGDYHLKSEGWSWHKREMHGSHWCYDDTTSPAVDAGDPMDSLGEELERVPVDPEGRWGVNRAVDMGAYGGTSQGSLSPTRGGEPGIGTVDLRDYWPFIVDNAWWTNYKDLSRWRLVQVAQPVDANGFEAYSLVINSAASNDWAYCVFVAGGLYLTNDIGSLDVLPKITELLNLRCPLFLTIDATILVPEDLLALGSVINRKVVVVRGSLEAVHAGLAYDATKYLDGSWPDVIAFRLVNADGTLAEPVAIFARGFGPLMLNGQPVDKATVDGVEFTVGHSR
jgi:hypothetical protein